MASDGETKSRAGVFVLQETLEAIRIGDLRRTSRHNHFMNKAFSEGPRKEWERERSGWS